MTITTLPVLKDNFAYVCTEPGGETCVIDPGEGEPLVKYLREQKLKLSKILCTHHHHDHIGGIGALKGLFPAAEVWASMVDRERIPGVTRGLRDGDSAIVSGEAMHVIAVPGHTRGQVAFYFPAVKALFTGDTLFSGGCGRLFEGTMAEMFTSLQKLKQLPSDTEIYFGHEYTLRNLEFIRSQLTATPADLTAYENACREKLAEGHFTSPSTLEQEMRINPFLYSEDVNTFSKWREARDHW